MRAAGAVHGGAAGAGAGGVQAPGSQVRAAAPAAGPALALRAASRLRVPGSLLPGLLAPRLHQCRPAAGPSADPHPPPTRPAHPLRDERNVCWCGDMNWADDRDGQMPLPPGWQDAWQVARPGQPGCTYDGRSNPMLGYTKYPGSRLDRCARAPSPPPRAATAPTPPLQRMAAAHVTACLSTSLLGLAAPAAELPCLASGRKTPPPLPPPPQGLSQDEGL
jgi:hypothetical protein